MKKPNIVYILADDMGYGDVSCLNEASKIKTVNLDRMSREGIVFHDAHSSSAVCTPSRYSILTGRYNWRSELKAGVLFGYDKAMIEENRETVASYLKRHDYNSACIGKWHLGWEWGLNSDDPQDINFHAPIKNGPTTRGGFDYFYGIIASLDIPPYVYVENDLITAVPDRETENSGKQFWRKGPTGADFIHEDVLPNFTDRACKYIEAQAGAENPFFLYFSLPSPHTPILPTAEFVGKSGTNEYGDFCLMTDDVVGQVMAALDKAGIADNTILVFTSDNGCSPMADFAELAACGHNPSYVFRGHKADIYEGGHRIPLLIRWPEQIRPGIESDDTVCLADLMATCAEIFDDELPDSVGEDSVSNLPVWLGTQGDEPLREATVHHSINGSFSIRQGRWKLEFCPGSGGWSYPRPESDEIKDLPPIQLYDLDADIGERENVQDKYPEIVNHLTTLMTKYVREGRSTPGTPQPNNGPKYWPQLNWMMKK
ncbi:MAG: arylsulfatase [Victivallaceae bacterium]|nr:arylsulfatase [Victivallaceae bacterium]